MKRTETDFPMPITSKGKERVGKDRPGSEGPSDVVAPEVQPEISESQTREQRIAAWKQENARRQSERNERKLAALARARETQERKSGKTPTSAQSEREPLPELAEEESPLAEMHRKISKQKLPPLQQPPTHAVVKTPTPVPSPQTAKPPATKPTERLIPLPAADPEAGRKLAVELVKEASLMSFTPSDLVMYYDESTHQSITLSELLQLTKNPKTARDWAHMRAKLKPMPAVGEMRAFKPARAINIPSKTDIRDAMKLHNVNIVAGAYTRFIPPLATLPQEMQIEIRVGTEIVPGLPIVDSYPDFSAPGDRWQLPTFTPSYRRGAVDMRVLQVCAAMANSPKSVGAELAQRVKALLAELQSVGTRFYYGNGTPAGQMGRLRAVKEVRDSITSMVGKEVFGVKSEWKMDQRDYVRYRDIMNRLYPLKKVSFSFFDKKPSDVVAEEDAMSSSPEPIKFTGIELRSDAGPVWSKADRGSPVTLKRGQTFFQDLGIADYVISRLADVDDPEAIRSLFQWAMVVYLKPKAEVYAVEQYETKTRNIMVTTAGAFMPAQMLLKPTHQRAPQFGEGESLSMIGWSPYRWGMTRFIRHFFEDDTRIVVYADNVYAVLKNAKKEKFFLSIDGEKEEGSINIVEAQFEMRRTLEHFVGEDGGPGHDAAWSRYAETLYPLMLLESFGIIGPFQVRVPGMCSGGQGTAYMNEVKSIRWVNAFRIFQSKYPDGGNIDELEENQDSPNWQRASHSVGVKMKIEAAVPFYNWLDTGPDVKQADVLGFDFVWLDFIGVPGVAAPILNYERLLKALIFIKNSRDSAPEDSLIRLMRYRSLYIVGGWLYPGVEQLLKTLCFEILNDLEDASVPEELLIGVISLIYGEELAGTVAAEPAMRLFLTQRAVPTLYEMVALVADDDTAISFGRHWVREHPEMAHWVMNPHDYAKVLELEPEGTGHAPTLAVTGKLDHTAVVPMETYLQDYLARPKAIKDIASLVSQVDWVDAGEAPLFGAAKPPRTERVPTREPIIDVLRGHMGTADRWRQLTKDEKSALVDRITYALSPLVGKVVVLAKSANAPVDPWTAVKDRLATKLGVYWTAVALALRRLGVEQQTLVEDGGSLAPTSLADLNDPSFIQTLIQRFLTQKPP
jgi:hypothetical protein